MSIPNLCPVDAFRIASLPAEVGVPLVNTGLLCLLDGSPPAERLAQTMRTARSRLGNIKPRADDAYESLVSRATRAGLTLPAPPQTAADFVGWADAVRATVQQATAADPTALAAYSAGVAAGDLHLAMWVSNFLILLRKGAPEHAEIHRRAVALADALRDAAQKLIQALRQPAIPPAVRGVTDRLDTLLKQIPDLGTESAKEPEKSAHDWFLRVENELSELIPAFAFPPEPPVTAPPAAPEAALLSQILADPQDCKLRWRFAELAAQRNDPRGELVRAQLTVHELRQTDTPAAQEIPLAQRAAALIKFHPEWAEDLLQRGAQRVGYYRGFIGLIEIDALTFLQNADVLYRLAPIQHLQLRNASGHLAELATSPHLGRLHSLVLSENALVDSDVQALVGSPHLGALRALDLSNNKLTNAAVELIAASPNLGSLKYLNVEQNPCADPVDAQSYSDETHWVWVPREFAKQLEAKYGRKTYFHPLFEKWPPELDQL